MTAQPLALAARLMFAQPSARPPYGAAVDINPVDASAVSNRIVPSRGYATPSANKLTSLLLTESDVAVTVTTHNYAVGPDGVTANAHRVQCPTEGDVMRLFSGGSQTVEVKLKVKSSPGAGAQTIKAGAYNTNMSSYSITESGWTAIDKTVTAASNFSLTSSGAVATDFLFAEAQIYDSGDTIPTFATEHPSIGALVPLTLADANSITLAGPDSVSNFSGRIKLTSEGISNLSFSSGSFVCAVRADGSSPSFASVLSTGDGFDFIVAFGASGNFADLVMPGITVRSYTKVVGLGWIILGGTFSANASDVFIDGISMLAASSPLEGTPTGTGSGGTPVVAPYLRYGGSGQNDAAAFNGRVGPCQIWPNRVLTDAEMMQAVLLMKASLGTNGETVSNIIRNVLIWDGDSLSGGYTLVQKDTFVHLAPALFSPTMLHVNYAVFGAQLGNPNGSTGNSLYQTSRIGGMLRSISQATAAGYNPIAGFLIGTNVIPPIADWRAYCTLLRNAGAKVIVCTVPDRTDIPGWETSSQQPFNALVRSSSAYYDQLVDFGLDANLGVAGAANDTTYFDVDKVHFNATGQAYAAGLLQPKIAALMV